MAWTVSTSDIKYERFSYLKHYHFTKDLFYLKILQKNDFQEHITN